MGQCPRGRIKSGPLRQTPRSFSRLPESNQDVVRFKSRYINHKSRRRKVTKTKRFFCEKCAGAATLCIDSKKSLMILARTRKAVLQYCSSGPQPANLCDPKIKTLQQLQPSKKKTSPLSFPCNLRASSHGF